MKLTDISRTTQTYRAWNRLLRKDQVTEQGSSITINLLTEPSSNARWKGLYARDPNGNQDGALTSGTVPWRFGDWFWDYDENEQDINSGEAAIQDYIKMKRHRGFTGWANHFESWFWTTPPNSTDVETPYNLRYWLTKNITTAGDVDSVAGSGSFSGTFPTGGDGVAHTTFGSAITHSRFRNWTYKYTDISDADLLERMALMVKMIEFEPIAGTSYPAHASGPPVHEHLCPLEIVLGLERLARSRNDNLGYDLASQTVTYARAPFTWVKQLNDDSDDPIYTMDWSAWSTCILKGMWMKSRPPMNLPDQHTVWRNWQDVRMNTVLWDRRRCAVGSRAAANP